MTDAIHPTEVPALVDELEVRIRQEATGRHWLTRFDPADGAPYGELCSCPHGDDHTLADLECTCAMTESSQLGCARHGLDAPEQ